jgi:hypothetical protein
MFEAVIVLIVFALGFACGRARRRPYITTERILAGYDIAGKNGDSSCLTIWRLRDDGTMELIETEHGV